MGGGVQEKGRNGGKVGERAGGREGGIEERGEERSGKGKRVRGEAAMMEVER